MTLHPLPEGLSFTRKQIAVTFNIVRSDNSIDSLTLESDYRIHATVDHAGMSLGSELSMEIWGMGMKEMNRLSYVANLPNTENPRLVDQGRSTIIVRVGDYGQPLTTLFMGQLTEGYASYSKGDPVFRLHAMTSTLLAKKVPAPLSYRGPRSVISILSDVCTAAGCQLIDHGGWDRTATLTNTYLEGTPLQQFEKIVLYACRGAYNFQPIDLKGFQPPRSEVKKNEAKRTPVVGIVEVWGPTYIGPTKSALPTLPVISTATGLIDYPQYNPKGGILISCLLRPDLVYYHPLRLEETDTPTGWKADHNGFNLYGQAVDKAPAPWAGTWLPFYIRHKVSSEIKDGPWNTYLQCRRVTPREHLPL